MGSTTSPARNQEDGLQGVVGYWGVRQLHMLCEFEYPMHWCDTVTQQDHVSVVHLSHLQSGTGMAVRSRSMVRLYACCGTYILK
jgi:hypothetical protein